MRTGVIESQGHRPSPPTGAFRPADPACDSLKATAILFDGARSVRVEDLPLITPQTDDVLVDVLWSGVSTGTERMMWSGDMPAFPGMGYPLVPGYEAVGRISDAPSDPHRVGELVFVPGARCYAGAHALFGASASHLVVPSARAHRLDIPCPREGVLMALAATAYHALSGGPLPELIIGHGVLGRLTARLACALGARPVVWETNPARRVGGRDYEVISPEQDTRRDYSAACDMSGDSGILDKVLPHMTPGGEICLAGFYAARPSFSFPLAFRKEMHLRVAAEWRPEDLKAVLALASAGRLDLDGLITHVRPAREARDAYEQAFTDPACLKMIIDWEPSDA